MCGIHFDSKQFESFCFVCGQVSQEEELHFVSKWGIALCSTCYELLQTDEAFEMKLREKLKNPSL